MSSGVIDEQERAELEAAEKGIRLTRPATYQRQTHMTPEQLAQVPQPQYLHDHWQWHQRTHQATIEYLIHKALGESVSQQQLADEFGVTKHMIKWRLRIYRGYDAGKHQAEYWRRKEERDAQIQESGMYAPALQYERFVEELAQGVQDLEALLTEIDAMEAYHQANEILCNIVSLYAMQINRDDLTNVLSDIIHTFGNIVGRVGCEELGFVRLITPGLRGIRYTPAKKHELFVEDILLSLQQMVNWLNINDVWLSYFQASKELCHVISLLTSQLQDDAAITAGKIVISLFEAIAARVASNSSS